ncbi:MAG: alpha/beta hydrolase-fold protein [Oscillospiraceae bacterium]|nr:alpha/beta hydrolase-fold protein [Oscillospiraceae bacterium]
MKGTIQHFSCVGQDCFVYCPPGYEQTPRPYPVIYACGEREEEALPLFGRLEIQFRKGAAPFLLAGIGADWDRDLTPWPAPAAFRGSADFSGGARQYLSALCETVKPLVDQRYRTLPDAAHTAIYGYSLGGLAALYALYLRPEFGFLASVSGSLWYENWLAFMSENVPANPGADVYLSLGRGEEKSRHPLIGKIGDCTRAAQEILSEQLDRDIPLVWSDGGHYSQILERKEQALLWIASHWCETPLPEMP